ncbi:uncharacterized protein LOC143243962 [Tachypleus tridentatus]|uniref:uncharacterized protein LOC143243962 n=1 Tax=Tachypleus tridentatus TaxID=6853 RepID=UPI003FCFA7C4
MKVFVTLSVIVCLWAIAYGQQTQQSIACSVPSDKMEIFFSCVRGDPQITSFLDKWDTCKNSYFPTATDGQVLQQMCTNIMVKAAMVKCMDAQLTQYYTQIKTVAENCKLSV